MKRVSCETKELSFGPARLHREGERLTVSLAYNGAYGMGEKYDSLNQLTKVTCQNGDVYTYTYTSNGNLSEVKKNGTTIKSYGYTDSVWKDLLTAFNGQTITYDGIGNPLGAGNRGRHGKRQVHHLKPWRGQSPGGRPTDSTSTTAC